MNTPETTSQAEPAGQLPGVGSATGSDSSPDYVQTWSETWKDICTNPDGSLNLDAIQRELHDYWRMLGNVGRVYDHVTGGRLSKPNHRAETIIAEHDAYVQRLMEEHEKEVREMVADETG